MTDRNLRFRVKFSIDRLGSVSEAAQEIGLDKDMLHAWIRGARKPKVETLIKIAKSCGVDLVWLITGEGSPNENELPQPAIQTLDPDLHRWIVEGLSKLYKEMGIHMSAGDRGYKEAEIHNHIILEASTLDGRREALKDYFEEYRIKLITQSDSERKMGQG